MLPRQPSLFVVRSSDGAEFGLLPEDFRDVSTCVRAGSFPVEFTIADEALDRLAGSTSSSTTCCRRSSRSRPNASYS